jgi:hypothetical protein
MDSESDRGINIVPANNKCSSVVNSNVIVSTPGSSTANQNTKLNAMSNQNTENTKYDSVEEPKPMFGGVKNNKYLVKFKNNIFNIDAINEIEAIKIALNGKLYKTDFFLDISILDKNKTINKNINKNSSSTYIIRGSKIKNKFIKI